MVDGQSPIPGWYTDPFDASQIRWWDGEAWTQHAKPFPAAAAPEATPVVQAPSPPPVNPSPAYSTPQAPEQSVAPGLLDPSATAGSVLPGVEQSSAPATGSPAQQPDSSSTGIQYPPATPPVRPESHVGGAATTGYPFANYPGEPAPQAPPDLSYGLPQAAPHAVEPGQPFGQTGGTPTHFGAGDYQPTYGGGTPSGDAGLPAGGVGYGAYPGYGSQPGGSEVGVQPQAYNEPAGSPPAGPAAKSSKTMLILLIVLGLVVIAAAAVWFFMLRSSDAPAPKVPGPTTATTPASPGAATTPGAPAAGVIAPAACSSAISALTADGSASTVVNRLEAAATNQSLAEAAGFFTDVTQQTAALMASSGSPCVDAVKTGQAPASYATFIEQFSKATHDGAAIAGQGAAANGILTPEQAAALRADAAALAAAATAVAPSAPQAAPAPAS